MFTSSDASADRLSITFASGRIVLAYSGSFTALRPAEVRERDKSVYASYVLTALRQQPAAAANTGGGPYGYDWKDATRSSAPCATLTIARTFDQYIVNIAIIPLKLVSATSPSPSMPPAYSQSLFPLLHAVRGGIARLQERDRAERERQKVQQRQLELIDSLLDDKSTQAEAVEEEWLGACMRLLNAEKAKIRDVRARTERVRNETAALSAKSLPAASSRLSDSDSESEEEKGESKEAGVVEGEEMKAGGSDAVAVDDGPALSFDSGSIELSLHPDSSLPPASFASMPSLHVDGDSQRSSSTSSSLASTSSLSRTSGGESGGDSTRRSVRKRARLQPATQSTSSAHSSASGTPLLTPASLSSSLNGSSRLLPPPHSSAAGKMGAPTVRAASPANTLATAARQGVTGLLDEL